LTISILVPIHDKPREVVQRVLGALSEQKADQLVIVLDRATDAVCGVMDGFDCLGPEHVTVMLDGKPGWRSPCYSFNAGLKEVTSEITIINHSDVVPAQGNLDVVRQHFQVHPNSALFGKVEESNPEQLEGPGNAGPLLMGTSNQRPLTWLLAVPTHTLKQIGGWDEAYQEGVCYEDDDLTTRLWKAGLDFTFNDSFSATHITHSRAYFASFRTLPNLNRFVATHGARDARSAILKTHPTITSNHTCVTWRHHASHTI
jgi:Glycosyl transferase family 2